VAVTVQFDPDMEAGAGSGEVNIVMVYQPLNTASMTLLTMPMCIGVLAFEKHDKETALWLDG